MAIAPANDVVHTKRAHVKMPANPIAIITGLYLSNHCHLIRTTKCVYYLEHFVLQTETNLKKSVISKTIISWSAVEYVAYGHTSLFSWKKKYNNNMKAVNSSKIELWLFHYRNQLTSSVVILRHGYAINSVTYDSDGRNSFRNPKKQSTKDIFNQLNMIYENWNIFLYKQSLLSINFWLRTWSWCLYTHRLHRY